jgi:hypothetical protein
MRFSAETGQPFLKSLNGSTGVGVQASAGPSQQAKA